MTNPREQRRIIAKLNSYDGDNIWEDIIYRLPTFDGAATEELDLRFSDRFVAGGTQYRYDEPQHEWTVRGGQR